LPVAAEVDRWPAPHRQPDDAVDLLAVADAAVVLTPRHFLDVTEKIPPGDVMMMPEFAAPQTREIGLGAIGVGAVKAVGFLMDDPLHGKADVQLVPGGAFVGMQHGALGDALADRWHRRGLGQRHLNQGAPRAFAHHNDDLALARAVLAEPTIEPVGRPVLRPDVAAEIGAVDLGHSPPMRSAFMLDAMASRSLCARTNAVLYWTSSSRLSARMLLPLTSLQKAAMASR